MRPVEELKELISFAKDQGMDRIEVDGVLFYVERAPVIYGPVKAIPGVDEVKDVPVAEIVAPMSELDLMSDEEIAYFATPYFDEMQAKKEAQKERLKNGDL